MRTCNHETIARAKCRASQAAGGFGVTDSPVPADVFARVNFFNNDLDTESSGIDIVATYSIDSRASPTVFGETPDRAKFEACCGRVYRFDSMIPWQGAYYYPRLQAGMWPASADTHFTSRKARRNRHI